MERSGWLVRFASCCIFRYKTGLSHCHRIYYFAYCGNYCCRHPLHLACLCHCPSTIASTVLNAYPEAAAIADSVELQYPLHIAALHGANATLLQRLYKGYPEAIRARTKTHGWLPLHLACHKDATPGAIRVLLEYYPEAAKAS
jgi:hypothetical protein